MDTHRPPQRGVKVVPAGRRLRTADTPVLIGSVVAAALTEHSGDLEAATNTLVKKAIPDAMALLDHSRKGGRYEVVVHPWLPDVRKQSSRGAEQIWEARPKWTRPEIPPGEHKITALDVNGAYLSALKTHLPLGQLEHSAGDQHDRRRSGVHLITPPDWDHDAYLSNPIGSRDEPGPLWVTETTLCLLLRVSSAKYGLCDPPEIHESWTSGATEGLLEKFRVALKDARDRAITEDDEVTLEYVKAMYSKFVSTLGEFNYNRELYRTDWMHLIRSQAFATLWWKAHRAYDERLMVVRVLGTDELHVTGDWRAVFPEGRGVAELKVKDVYTVGTGPADDACEPLCAHERPSPGRAARSGACRRGTLTSASSEACGVRGFEAVARQLDALAGFVATPITQSRGLLARLHYLTRSNHARQAAREAGLTVTDRTLRAWLDGSRSPSRRNLQAIETAYRTIRRHNVARYLTARLNDDAWINDATVDLGSE